MGRRVLMWVHSCRWPSLALPAQLSWHDTLQKKNVHVWPDLGPNGKVIVAPAPILQTSGECFGLHMNMNIRPCMPVLVFSLQNRRVCSWRKLKQWKRGQLEPPCLKVYSWHCYSGSKKDLHSPHVRPDETDEWGGTVSSLYMTKEKTNAFEGRFWEGVYSSSACCSREITVNSCHFVVVTYSTHWMVSLQYLF